MPNQTSLEQIEMVELTQSIGDARAADDPFKLRAALRTLLDTRLAVLKTNDVATFSTEGGRATASRNVRAALDQLQTLLRDGYNFLQGLRGYAISEADRIGLLISYGWESGLVGAFDDARIESLANQAIAITPTITDAAHRYPAALLTLITAQLAIVNANQPVATGGSAQVATDERDAALELLSRANSRVRFFYCSVSDAIDQTPELVKINRQPRRDQGTAATQPLPGPVGPVTFDAAALTLTAPALPEHGTTMRAYRRAAGGTAELAGTSNTTTVSVVALGPLTPGVTYEFWLTGHNSQGDGPESNHVTLVAT